MADDKMNFGQAFREAKRAGMQEFEWRGRKFTTTTAGEAPQQQWQPQLAPDIVPQAPVNMQQQAAPVPFPTMAAGGPNVPPSSGQFPTAGAIQVTGTPQADGFDMAGADTSWMVEPPKTPEERADRVSSWQDVLGKITSNPMMLAAMLRMGTQLMQPIQPGQSVGGHVGQALAGTVDYMQAMNMANRKMGLEEQRVGADIEQSRAATEASRAQVDLAKSKDSRDAQKFPKEMEVLAKQLAAAKTQDDVAQVELKIKQFQSRPEFMQTQQTMEIDKLKIQMQAERARIAAYNAALARANRESSAMTAAEKKLQAEEDASIEYVTQVDGAIQQLADELSAKSGKTIPFALARERFFDGKPTLADHYYKYVGLAEKRRKEREAVPGAPGAPTPKPANPGAKETDAKQSDKQILDRTLGQDGYTVIRNPDGSLRVVPVKPVNLGKPDSDYPVLGDSP